MKKTTLDLELGKNLTFVAKYSKTTNKVIIIIPKEYHNAITKLKNPLKVFVEEII